jgi:phosphatidylglycerophosphate synthase
VRLAVRLRLTPNAVTGMSVGLAVIAAIWFSAGDRTAQVIGAVALYLSFVLDCVDGQLARYTRRFSPLGAWLDGISDRVKEYVVYVGLAVGYAAGAHGGPTGPHGIWALAVGAMILQSIRHMVDFSYSGAVADADTAATASTCRRSPLSVSADPTRTDPTRTDAGRSDPARTDSVHVESVHGGHADSVRTANVVVEMSRRLNRGTATRWLKKVIVLPIGERMALIAVTAALFNARVTFLALLTWGGVALAYTVTGRIARSLT